MSNNKMEEDGASETSEIPTATYEELAELELEFEEVDTEILAKHYALNKPIFAKRDVAVAKIKEFWPLVFEQAPPDIDGYIQPTDSAVFAACLTDVSVTRPEVPDSYDPRAPSSPKNAFGEPRTVRFRFTFAENEWFTNKVLEKTFCFRRAKDGWAGHASEPVKIHWKKGKDLTDGLTDASVALWQAQQKSVVAKGIDVGSKEGRQASEQLKEFKELKALVDKSMEGSLSFFNWFGSRGRWVTDEESREAAKKEKENRAKKARGEKVEDSDDEDDEDDEFDMAEIDTEIFPAGEEVAIAIAEDLWPGAIRYFTEAQELNLSDSEDDFVEEEDAMMKDADDDDDDDEEEDEDESDSDEDMAPAPQKVPDIRSLVNQKGGKPVKKAAPAPSSSKKSSKK